MNISAKTKILAKTILACYSGAYRRVRFIKEKTQKSRDPAFLKEFMSSKILFTLSLQCWRQYSRNMKKKNFKFSNVKWIHTVSMFYWICTFYLAFLVLADFPLFLMEVIFQLKLKIQFFLFILPISHIKFIFSLFF